MALGFLGKSCEILKAYTFYFISLAFLIIIKALRKYNNQTPRRNTYEQHCNFYHRRIS